MGFCYSDPRTLFQLDCPPFSWAFISQIDSCLPFCKPHVIRDRWLYREARIRGLLSLFHWGHLGSSGRLHRVTSSVLLCMVVTCISQAILGSPWCQQAMTSVFSRAGADPKSCKILVPLKWLRGSAGGAGTSCCVSTNKAKVSHSHPTVNRALKTGIFTSIVIWAGCCTWFHSSSQVKEFLSSYRNPWMNNMGNWSDARRHRDTTMEACTRGEWCLPLGTVTDAADVTAGFFLGWFQTLIWIDKGAVTLRLDLLRTTWWITLFSVTWPDINHE